MTDEQRLKAIFKRDKEISTRYFRTPIIKKETSKSSPFKFDHSSGKFLSYTRGLGKKSARVGHMHGQV